MSTFVPSPNDFLTSRVRGGTEVLFRREAADRFDTHLLGLGDINTQARTIEAIAAVFDLQGFTNFCKQIEPQLSVPFFLNEFPHWMFEQIRDQMTRSEHQKGLLL
ncbi:MAG TPA: hypothetical protein VEA40_15350 [Ramlibacter sp.]|nr:hypothetical protein [Ramlibacter sp.]